jgi:hypothetical protein
MEDKILKAFMRGMVDIGKEHPTMLRLFIDKVNKDFEEADLTCRYFFDGNRLYLSKIISYIV